LSDHIGSSKDEPALIRVQLGLCQAELSHAHIRSSQAHLRLSQVGPILECVESGRLGSSQVRPISGKSSSHQAKLSRGQYWVKSNESMLMQVEPTWARVKSVTR